MRNNNSIVWVCVGLALLGFADAVYLTISHYTHFTLPCSIVHGCQVVTTSAYSMIGPLPLALIGALYYLTVLICLVVYIDTKKRSALLAVHIFTFLGFCYSIFLLIVQAFILQAFCLYCLISVGTTTLLFIAGAFLVHGKRFIGPMQD